VGDTNVVLSVATAGPVFSYQWFKGSTPITDATNVSYTLPAITATDNGATFHVAVSNNMNVAQSQNSIITVGSLVGLRVAREQLWFTATRLGIESGLQDTVTPDRDYSISFFQTPEAQGDTYADRLSAIFVAPVSGNYVFFVNGDDDSDLFVSTDATPANKQLVAQEVDWAGNQEWVGNSGGSANHQVTQKRSDQWVPDPANPPATPPFAAGIPLQQGQSYYIEAVHHDGGGGDQVEATYKLVGEPDPNNGDVTKINAFSSTMGPYVQGLDGAYIVVTNPPASTVFGFQSQTATFSASAAAHYTGDPSTASPSIAYQWQTAPAGSSTFTNIPSANGTSYTTPLLTLADQGRQYRVTIVAGDAITNSTVGTLSVIHDTTPPAITAAGGSGPSLRVVTVTFNELLDKASAETAANYVFNPGGIVATNASLDASGKVVTLQTGTRLPANVLDTLTVTGVKDLAGNAVASNTTASFTLNPVTYEADIVFDKPVAYFRFEDAVGSPVAHNTGNGGVEGAYYTGNEPSAGAGGTPSQAHGDPGPRPPAFAGFDPANNSATFDGVGEWVDARAQYLQGRSSFTLEYWVRPTNRVADPTAFGTRIGLVGQNDAIEYGFIDANTIQIWTPNGGSLNTAYTNADNEWHHVATIASGTQLLTYYDGQLRGSSSTTTGNYGTSTYNVHIGGGGVFDVNGNYFTGNIDEVAIFTNAIPAARVAEHYSAGKNGGLLTVPGPITPTPTVKASIIRSGNNLVISWAPSGGTLQSKTSLDGLSTGWSNVGTANPAVVPRSKEK